MNNKCLIYCVYGSQGGTATLSFRIAKNVQSKGYDIYYLRAEDNDQTNAGMLKQLGVNVITVPISSWEKQLIKIIQKYDEAKIIIYSFEFLGLQEKVLKYFHKKDTNKVVGGFLYVVVNECLTRGNSLRDKHPKLSYLLNLLDIPIILDAYLKGRIIFMDDTTIRYTENALNIRLADKKEHIILLPYTMSSNVSPKSKNDKFVISTMARIDFPFKGYVLGLIDICKKISINYPLELWIIGDGVDYERVSSKAEKTENDRLTIKMLGNMTYDKAKATIRRSDLFVGMGTGILDAASQYIPSIPVQTYQYDCLGKNYFHCDPRILGYPSNEEDLNDITPIIEKTIKMSENEYSDLCSKEHDAVNNNYNMSIFTNYLINNRLDAELNKNVITQFNMNLFFLKLYSHENSLKGL